MHAIPCCVEGNRRCIRKAGTSWPNATMIAWLSDCIVDTCMSLYIMMVQ